MVDKITAQRDVEYFYELLAKETDENKRAILQRLLAEAEKRRQSTTKRKPAIRKRTSAKSKSETVELCHARESGYPESAGVDVIAAQSNRMSNALLDHPPSRMMTVTETSRTPTDGAARHR